MKHTDFVITKGGIGDIDSIVLFQMEMALESEGTILNQETVKKGVTAVINDDFKGTYWVAKHQGNAIGSLMITREWSDWNNQWYWWIQSVYIKPEYRKQGVFKAMYSSVKESARENGVSQVRLYVDKTNHPAQTAYHKLGMCETHYLMFEENIK